MPTRLKYEGLPLLAEALAPSALALATGGNLAAAAPTPAMRWAACAAAARAGLSLGDRRRAVLAWAEMLGGEGAPDGDDIGALIEFLESGLAESVKLLDDPAEVEKVSTAADLLGARAVTRAPDAGRARVLLERLSDSLPVAPECTLTAILLRPDTEPNAQTFEDATTVLETSADRERLAMARAVVLDDTTLRAHHRARMEEKDKQRLRELEALDRALDAEFGDTAAFGARSAGWAAVGAVVAVFSKSVQARKEAIQQSRNEWLSRLSSSAGSSLFGRDAYIDAYATFLEGRIDAVHQEIKAGIKELRSALEKGFDPETTLNLLCAVLTFRKKDEEARSLLEEWAPQIGGVAPAGSEGFLAPLLVKVYREVGGNPANLSTGAQAPFVAEAAAKNRSRRKESFVQASAAAQRKVANLLSANERAGLTLIDSALHPQDYEAALLGGTTSGRCRIEGREAARLCLDETPVVRELGVAKLCSLAGEGLPSHEAASFAIALLDALRHRDRLGADDLQKLAPTLHKARAYAERELGASLKDERLDELRDRIVRFIKSGAVDDDRGAELASTLMARRSAQGGDLAAVEDGERLSRALRGDGRKRVVRDTVRRYAALADATKSLDGKIQHLARAAELDPTDAEVADRLKKLQSARTIRNLKIAGVIAGVAGVAALAYHLLG